jgi:hypothetical protein
MGIGGVLLIAIAALAIVATILAHRAEPYLRARIVQALEDRFHARVELDSFHMSVRSGLDGHWGVWAEGKGLRIWPPANVEGVSVPGPGAPPASDEKPLIQLDEFSFHAPLIYRRGLPFHISVVELKGLNADVPPKSHFHHGAAVDNGPSKSAGSPLQFSVDSIDCSDARLVLETSKPGKLPLEIAIAHLKLTNVSKGSEMGFEAELTNPRPTGAIHTTGSFGPWDTADPGESAVKGDYQFNHADLGDFKGIAGILSSTGHYNGTLRDLIVDGETDTPDFRLEPFDNPLPLHTRFHAKVDATNGDTWLQPVEATLGRSHFTAQGQVVRVLAPGTASGDPNHSLGHDIALNVNVDHGRIEDFLRLASHGGTPVLTGAVTLKTTLHIPPGPAPVHQRLALNGSFVLDQAQFSDAKIQGGIQQLSLRGQGRPKDMKSTDPGSIASRMEGDFKMGGGVIKLPNLAYTVPGAAIELAGTYGVVGGTLDFTGNAKMDASVSQMVGGWKGLLLSPLDRYLKRDGAGTEVPIHIRGTRDRPQFGIDIDRMIRKRPPPAQAPSQPMQPTQGDPPVQTTDQH